MFYGLAEFLSQLKAFKEHVALKNHITWFSCRNHLPQMSHHHNINHGPWPEFCDFAPQCRIPTPLSALAVWSCECAVVTSSSQYKMWLRLDLITHEPPLPHISRRWKEPVSWPRTHLHLKTCQFSVVFLCLNPAKVINYSHMHGQVKVLGRTGDKDKIV